MSSRCKGFTGILLTALVKILSFDCHLIEEKTEKTWGRASPSPRLRTCGFLSDLGATTKLTIMFVVYAFIFLEKMI